MGQVKSTPYTLVRANKRLTFKVEQSGDRIKTSLFDDELGMAYFDDEYVYRVMVGISGGTMTYQGLRHTSLKEEGTALIIEGDVAGLRLKHTLCLASDEAYLDETIQLTNPGKETIPVVHYEFGFQRKVTKQPSWNEENFVAEELRDCLLTAIPFKHRASDHREFDHSFTMQQLLEIGGAEHRMSNNLGFSMYPAMHRSSEGWAWQFENSTMSVFSFSQEHMIYSTIGFEINSNDTALRFGGGTMVDGEPDDARRLSGGQTITLGLSRLVITDKGYLPAAYAYRDFLDRHGCRFPANFNPPIHWNELYGNPELAIHSPGKPTAPRHSRRLTYTREMMETEARNAVAYSAEALYLDPGWDTHFGTFLWGDEWLGDRKEYIRFMQDQYGLYTSLHCPLAPWASIFTTDISSWPRDSYRWDEQGNVMEGMVCLGADSYIEEAAKRLKDNCKDGVIFLMFDGNWYNGGCWNPNHGHPVPFTKEDHSKANVKIANIVKESYPNVLIEMHDTVAGGSRPRYTPVYYRYGPQAYDMNWGFELMWAPMEDLLEGRARSLYYYNLGCNVPLYLHVDLRDDNENCLVLWWYASTCRHLGIGGVHRNPLIADAQRKAMITYRRLKRFYTRGEFFGSEECPEEVHIHVLKDENAAVVNLFNLSPDSKIIEGSVDIRSIGINPDEWFFTPQPNINLSNGRLYWKRRLPAYGTDVLEVYPVNSLKK